jgi:hypothetical protein
VRDDNIDGSHRFLQCRQGFQSRRAVAGLHLGQSVDFCSPGVPGNIRLQTNSDIPTFYES